MIYEHAYSIYILKLPEYQLNTKHLLGLGLGQRDDASRRHPYRASSPTRAGHVSVAPSMINSIDGNWYENECVSTGFFVGYEDDSKWKQQSTMRAQVSNLHISWCSYGNWSY